MTRSNKTKKLEEAILRELAFFAGYANANRQRAPYMAKKCTANILKACKKGGLKFVDNSAEFGEFSPVEDIDV